jgi:hypothetical protein
MPQLTQEHYHFFVLPIGIATVVIPLSAVLYAVVWLWKVGERHDNK